MEKINFKSKVSNKSLQPNRKNLKENKSNLNISDPDLKLKMDLEAFTSDLFGHENVPSVNNEFKDISGISSVQKLNIKEISNNITEEVVMSINNLTNAALDDPDSTIININNDGFFTTIWQYCSVGFYFDKIYKIGNFILSYILPESFYNSETQAKIKIENIQNLERSSIMSNENSKTLIENQISMDDVN